MPNDAINALPELQSIVSSPRSEKTTEVSIEPAPVDTPVDLLDYGDIILIRPGDLPPTDGSVVAGATTFDESSLTGESLPVHKRPDDPVLTGTVNLTSPVTMKVTALGQETMVEKIIRAVSDASAKKAPVEKLAESITGVFVPIIVYLALAVLIIWLSLTLAGVVPETYLPNGRTGTGDKVFFAFQL
jgi:P-type E1-E2 ATPase